MANTLEQWYASIPTVTRMYLTLTFAVTVGCALEVRAFESRRRDSFFLSFRSLTMQIFYFARRAIDRYDGARANETLTRRRFASHSSIVGPRAQLISPLNVYFNSKLIFQEYELWRLVTNFFFFGSLGVDFVFHMFFLSRYCRMLEEGSFQGRSCDFFYMLLFGGCMLTALAPFVNVQFLGTSLTFMMVYVWGRRNASAQMSFLGLFTFTAPYLPWVLLIFSTIIGSQPVTDALGLIAGHAYYFLKDVYPDMTGREPLATPGIVCALFGAQTRARAAAVDVRGVETVAAGRRVGDANGEG